jgi:hypothetical protein
MDTTTPPAGGSAEPLQPAPLVPPPFRQLLYRYWFFGWLFRDVNRPNLLERAAAWRHNRHQARWLPTYLRRWAVMTLLCFGIAALVEHGVGAPALSAVFYVQAVLGVTFNVVTSVMLLGLKMLPAPF